MASIDPIDLFTDHWIPSCVGPIAPLRGWSGTRFVSPAYIPTKDQQTLSSYLPPLPTDSAGMCANRPEAERTSPACS